MPMIAMTINNSRSENAPVRRVDFGAFMQRSLALAVPLRIRLEIFKSARVKCVNFPPNARISRINPLGTRGPIRARLANKPGDWSKQPGNACLSLNLRGMLHGRSGLSSGPVC